MFIVQALLLVPLISSVLAATKNVITKGDFQYTEFFPMKSSTITFQVKTAFDANVMISEKPNPNQDIDPFVEVVIGGGGNTGSVIRTDRPDLSQFKVFLKGIIGIVSPSEYRSFWIKFVGDTLLFGQGSDKLPLMVWKDPRQFKRNYFSVSSWGGSTGEWIIDLDAVDYEETSCSPLAVKSMDLPLRTTQANATAKLVDGACFDLLLHQCGVQRGGPGTKGDTVKARGIKRYIIDEELKSWDGAKAVCEGRGQTLASVRSKEEQQKLEEAIQNFSNPFSGVWLAANDRGHSGKFVWYDGTSDVMSYNNWENPPRSVSSSKNCVFVSYVSLVIKKQAYWYTQQCADTWNFACEAYE